MFVDAAFNLILKMVSNSTSNVKGSDLIYSCSQAEPIFKIIEDSGLMASFIDGLLGQFNVTALLPGLAGVFGAIETQVEAVVNGQLAAIDMENITTPLTTLVSAAGMTALSASLTLDAGSTGGARGPRSPPSVQT